MQEGRGDQPPVLPADDKLVYLRAESGEEIISKELLSG